MPFNRKILSLRTATKRSFRSVGSSFPCFRGALGFSNTSSIVTFDPGMAYQVAELFERHYTLVELAVHPDVGSQERIDAYMSGEFGRSELSAELGYRFAQELFKHYLAESTSGEHVA